MSNKKERIIIDQYLSEDGFELYFVADAKPSHYIGPRKNRWPVYSNMCCLCNSSGFFTDENALDEWLEENKDEIEILKDYRKD